MMHRPATSTVRCLLALIISSASLAACQSALDSPNAGRDRYTESLLVRSIYDRAQQGKTGIPLPTSNNGLVAFTRVEPRVDQKGPNGENLTIAQFAKQPSIQNAMQIGLDAARLNTPETPFPLTLKDAIARTAKHSVAIKVEGYGPAIRAAQIQEAEAIFDPVIFGQSQWTNTDTPQISPSFSNGQTWQNQIGVRKLLPTGTQVQASAGWTYRDITTPTGLQPIANKTTWASNLNLQITQPLGRGFGSNITQASIFLAQKDLSVSLATFKDKVITTVADVEEAYYNLVQARINVDILARLLVSGQETYTTIKNREFDVTKADLGQAEAALASRFADFRQAQRDYRNASDRIKALINDPEISISSNILIEPVDRPTTEAVSINLLDAMEIALQQRAELQQARLQVERANIVVTVARNDLLPKIDLTAGVTTNGLDNGLDQAFTTTVNPMHSIDWSAGIRLEFPIGNRAAESILTRRVLERGQALDQMIAVAQTIEQDVRLQIRDILFSFEEMQDREAQRLGAAKAFLGIIELETIRARSPEFLQLKLDNQSRLANAEQQLIRAILNYNLAIMRLERAKGTLLEYNQISLDRPPASIEDSQELNRYLHFSGSTKVTK